ncbi:unnamed protein product [Lasius platythorax]|uniref:Uncharacterized protein n=1 Tax=Lasius platythorax TaxID=488582 RepID=A0AAV2NNU0_9HYME
MKTRMGIKGIAGNCGLLRARMSRGRKIKKETLTYSATTVLSLPPPLSLSLSLSLSLCVELSAILLSIVTQLTPSCDAVLLRNENCQCDRNSRLQKLTAGRVLPSSAISMSLNGSVDRERGIRSEGTEIVQERKPCVGI